MRYILGARVRPDRRSDLLRSLEDGTFGEGSPYGDLGEMLRTGRVNESGTTRWVEACYCREYYGVAMHEELPYLEEYLTDIEVADARSPRYCKGYPECNDCACTRKVRFEGEPLLTTYGAPTSSLARPRRARITRHGGWAGGPGQPRRSPEEPGMSVGNIVPCLGGRNTRERTGC